MRAPARGRRVVRIRPLDLLIVMSVVRPDSAAIVAHAFERNSHVRTVIENISPTSIFRKGSGPILPVKEIDPSSLFVISVPFILVTRCLESASAEIPIRQNSIESFQLETMEIRNIFWQQAVVVPEPRAASYCWHLKVREG